MHTDSPVIDIQFSSARPLAFVQTYDRIMIVDIRNMFVSQGVIRERFEGICYCDRNDTLYLSKNSLLFKVERVYELHVIEQ